MAQDSVKSTILLIENNPGDVRLITEALKGNRVPIELEVARDGLEAMRMLRREDSYSNGSRPDIILMDLNLPKLNGREVLAAIKSDAALKCIPVVVLSSVESSGDILDTYNLHANCYVVKPTDLPEFSRAIQAIQDFWLNTVKLPTEPAK